MSSGRHRVVLTSGATWLTRVARPVLAGLMAVALLAGGLLSAPSAASRIRAAHQLVFDREVEDLRQALQGLVDLLGAELPLAQLRRLVSVDLDDRDLREAMLCKE